MSDQPTLTVHKVTPGWRSKVPFCRCGVRFAYLAKTESGKKLYYWCWFCDTAGGKK